MRKELLQLEFDIKNLKNVIELLKERNIGEIERKKKEILNRLEHEYEIKLDRYEREKEFEQLQKEEEIKYKQREFEWKKHLFSKIKIINN